MMMSLFCGLGLLLYSNVAFCHSLVTGGVGGPYHTTGHAIQALSGGMIDLVAESSGSIENLQRLLNDVDIEQGASLAIVQHDILLRLTMQAKGEALAPSLRQLQGKAGKLRSLLALYPEFVQLLVAEDSSINSIFQLAGRPVYLGGKNSGSKINALDLMDFIALARLEVNEQPELQFTDVVYLRDLKELINSDTLSSEYPPSLVKLIAEATDLDQPINTSVALDLVRDGVIAAAFITQGALVDQPGLRQVFLRPELIRNFAAQNRYYGIRELRDPKSNKPVFLPFVRAILVGLPEHAPKGLSNADAYNLVKSLYTNRMTLETRVVSSLDTNIDFFVGDHMIRGISGQMHHGASEFFKSQNIIPRVSVTEWLFVVPLFIIALTLLGHAFRHSILLSPVLRSGFVRQRFVLGSRLSYWWGTYQSWIVGSWIMILLWVFTIIFVAVIYFIRFIEQQNSILLDVENPFAGASFWDAVFWMVTFTATGFNQDIYPNTLAARILAVAVPLSGLFLTLFVLVSRTFRSEQQAEKRACGLLPPGEIRDHLIIFGWNNRVERLIQDILAPGSPLDLRARLLVVAETEKLKPFEGMNIDTSRLIYLRGQGTTPDVLDMARLEYARGAIVLADSTHVERHNTRSILTCSTIIKRLLRAGRNDFPVVAELVYEDNRAYFEQAGISKLCSLGLISSRFVSSAVLNPGVSGLLISLLRFSYSRSARRLSVRELEKLGLKPGSLSGCLFAEALLKLRQIGVLLLAVIDREKLFDSSVLEIEFREDSPYIFGTTGDSETYRIKADDDLLVVVPNKIASAQEKRFLGREGLTHFAEGEEVVLLIGNGDIGQEIVEALLPRCQKLIRCVPAASIAGTHWHFTESVRLEIIKAPDVFTLEFFQENAAFFHDVSRVVILGPDRVVHRGMPEHLQDDETLRTALIIKRASAAIFQRGQGIHLAAEMRSIDNLSLFHDVGIDQPIPVALLLEQILIHMAFHRGILSEFLLKAMSLSPANQRGRLARLTMPDIETRVSQRLVGLTYDELLARLIEKRVQLLAIQKGQGLGMEYLLIVCPQAREVGAIDYRVREEDFLFCFLPT